MYDFYFGSDDEIRRDEIKYLISIKRMLPRWINSLPDSEFIALAELLDEQGKNAQQSDRNLIAAETGVGASSLVFIFYAMKYKGRSFTWDLNGEKGSLIRTVCTETMGNHFRQPVSEYWQMVSFNSTSEQLGLSIIGELDLKLDMFFHDSEHVWTTVEQELLQVMPLLQENAVVALDDANQDYLHTNLAYVNTFRKKLHLPVIAEIPDNKTEPFYRMVQRLLEKHWRNVEYLHDCYKEQYDADPYFAYYNAEFDIKAGLGTERTEALEHRFDSWRISGRKKAGRHP